MTLTKALSFPQHFLLLDETYVGLISYFLGWYSQASGIYINFNLYGKKSVLEILSPQVYKYLYFFSVHNAIIFFFEETKEVKDENPEGSQSYFPNRLSGSIVVFAFFFNKGIIKTNSW